MPMFTDPTGTVSIKALDYDAQTKAAYQAGQGIRALWDFFNDELPYQVRDREISFLKEFGGGITDWGDPTQVFNLATKAQDYGLDDLFTKLVEKSIGASEKIKEKQLSKTAKDPKIFTPLSDTEATGFREGFLTFAESAGIPVDSGALSKGRGKIAADLDTYATSFKQMLRQPEYAGVGMNPALFEAAKVEYVYKPLLEKLQGTMGQSTKQGPASSTFSPDAVNKMEDWLKGSTVAP
jgi:hypothetical protein